MSINQLPLLGPSGAPRLIRDLSIPLGAQGEVPLSESGHMEAELTSTFEQSEVDATGVKPL